MPTSAIILAAGKSTRMKSRRPKPMHEVCGRPMLEHVLRACYDAGVSRVSVVVGHGKDEVMGYFSGDRRITWVEQTEQLGTGHAARMCEQQIRDSRGGEIFILAGDGPLIRAQVLKTLLEAHREDAAAASMATAVLDDPTGYGRVIRDADGNFIEIIEQNDATPEQKLLREVFPSYYCFEADALLGALSKLKNNNAKREYYLTDTYAHVQQAGGKVLAVQAVTQDDVLGVNTREQLAHVDSIMQGRIQRELRESGVTIVNSAQTYIEAGVDVGPDTVIHPFTFIGAGAVVGGNCTIGPFARVPRGAVIPANTTVSGGGAQA